MIQQAHQIWWSNYNQEKHYAHRERQDGLSAFGEVFEDDFPNHAATFDEGVGFAQVLGIER